MSALNMIYKKRTTFGIELPLDRDWTEAVQRRADCRRLGADPTDGNRVAPDWKNKQACQQSACSGNHVERRGDRPN